MEGHERWWDKIWMEAEKKGDMEVTFTPEHGPPNYQVRGHIYIRILTFKQLGLSSHLLQNIVPQTTGLDFTFTPEY